MAGAGPVLASWDGGTNSLTLCAQTLLNVAFLLIMGGAGCCCQSRKATRRCSLNTGCSAGQHWLCSLGIERATQPRKRTALQNVARQCLPRHQESMALGVAATRVTSVMAGSLMAL